MIRIAVQKIGLKISILFLLSGNTYASQDCTKLQTEYKKAALTKFYKEVKIWHDETYMRNDVENFLPVDFETYERVRELRQQLGNLRSCEVPSPGEYICEKHKENYNILVRQGQNLFNMTESTKINILNGTEKELANEILRNQKVEEIAENINYFKFISKYLYIKGCEPEALPGTFDDDSSEIRTKIIQRGIRS